MKGRKKINKVVLKQIIVSVLNHFEVVGIDTSDFVKVADVLEKLGNVPAPSKGSGFSKAMYRVIRSLAVLCPKIGLGLPPSVLRPTMRRALQKQQLVTVSLKSEKSTAEIRAFYDSYKWAQLRYSVLLKYGRKCMCCGQDKGVMHVDHIKPVRRYWNLRMRESNLQVLCPDCNKGKCNWDETDFRTDKQKEILIPKRARLNRTSTLMRHEHGN